MAEVANPNLKTFYQGAGSDRGSADIFGTTDWSGGMNKSGSNAAGLGINTGDYDPKETDWSRQQRLAQRSQTIGHSDLPITVDQGADVNDNVSFVQADGDIAPDAEIRATTGALNKTGKTIPSGSWAWGLVPVA